ncbi:MAG: hypothetical protein P4L40_20800 [Terracidiphilus sp.]|nr:hypothetical protein [Terracidiphilus sp.]
MTAARRIVCRLVCAVLFAPLALTTFSQDRGTAAGPVPPAVTAARTVFVSNAGGDAGLFPSPFSGDPSRGYSTFYQKLKAAGSPQVVDNPAQADLVLEITLTAPNGSLSQNKVYGVADPLPMFRLTVYDRPTRTILWTETQSVQMANRQKTHDKNFDDAIDALVSRFLLISGHTSPPAAH